MLPNCPQAVISYYGTLLAGGIVVQTNPLYTEYELEYQLNDSGASVLVTMDLLYPKAEKVKGRTPVKHWIVTRMQDYLPTVKKWLYPLVQRKQNMPIVRIEETRNRSYVPHDRQSEGNRSDRGRHRSGGRCGAAAIYRRHDGASESGHVDASQFDRQYAHVRPLGV